MEVKDNPYAKKLAASSPKIVNCELPLMEERKILRGDRSLGLVRAQFVKMKDLDWNYDLEVDTSYKSPFDNAKKILEFLKNQKPRDL